MSDIEPNGQAHADKMLAESTRSDEPNPPDGITAQTASSTGLNTDDSTPKTTDYPSRLAGDGACESELDDTDHSSGTNVPRATKMKYQSTSHASQSYLRRPSPQVIIRQTGDSMVSRRPTDPRGAHMHRGVKRRCEHQGSTVHDKRRRRSGTLSRTRLSRTLVDKVSSGSDSSDAGPYDTVTHQDVIRGKWISKRSLTRTTTGGLRSKQDDSKPMATARADERLNLTLGPLEHGQAGTPNIPVTSVSTPTTVPSWTDFSLQPVTSDDIAFVTALIDTPDDMRNLSPPLPLTVSGVIFTQMLGLQTPALNRSTLASGY